MLSKETITFLKRLDRNNNREWLQSHKPDFEAAKEDFAKFISDLIGRIVQFDPKKVAPSVSPGIRSRDC